MKKEVCIGLGALLVASVASAQAPGGQKIGLAAAIQRSYNGIKANLNEAATKMPAADYKYTPSPEIRTYGGQLGHVAFFNYVFCSAAKGEANPNKKTQAEMEAVTNKDEMVKLLGDSFAYCDPIYAALTDETALQLVKQGPNEVARGAVLSNNTSHNNEEYGIVTVYLRTKSMVPPSTERAQRGRAGR